MKKHLDTFKLSGLLVFILGSGTVFTPMTAEATWCNPRDLFNRFKQGLGIGSSGVSHEAQEAMRRDEIADEGMARSGHTGPSGAGGAIINTPEVTRARSQLAEMTVPGGHDGDFVFLRNSRGEVTRVPVRDVSIHPTNGEFHVGSNNPRNMIHEGESYVFHADSMVDPRDIIGLDAAGHVTTNPAQMARVYSRQAANEAPLDPVTHFPRGNETPAFITVAQPNGEIRQVVGYLEHDAHGPGFRIFDDPPNSPNRRLLTLYTGDGPRPTVTASALREGSVIGPAAARMPAAPALATAEAPRGVPAAPRAPHPSAAPPTSRPVASTIPATNQGGPRAPVPVTNQGAAPARVVASSAAAATEVRLASNVLPANQRLRAPHGGAEFVFLEDASGNVRRVPIEDLRVLPNNHLVIAEKEGAASSLTSLDHVEIGQQVIFRPASIVQPDHVIGVDAVGRITTNPTEMVRVYSRNPRAPQLIDPSFFAPDSASANSPASIGVILRNPANGETTSQTMLGYLEHYENGSFRVFDSPPGHPNRAVLYHYDARSSGGPRAQLLIAPLDQPRDIASAAGQRVATAGPRANPVAPARPLAAARPATPALPAGRPTPLAVSPPTTNTPPTIAGTSQPLAPGSNHPFGHAYDILGREAVAADKAARAVGDRRAGVYYRGSDGSIAFAPVDMSASARLASQGRTGIVTSINGSPTRIPPDRLVTNPQELRAHLNAEISSRAPTGVASGLSAALEAGELTPGTVYLRDPYSHQVFSFNYAAAARDNPNSYGVTLSNGSFMMLTPTQLQSMVVTDTMAIQEARRQATAQAASATAASDPLAPFRNRGPSAPMAPAGRPEAGTSDGATQVMGSPQPRPGASFYQPASPLRPSGATQRGF